MRRRRREDLFKKSMGVLIQALSLLCLVIIVYIIGRSIIKTSPHSTAKNDVTTEESTVIKQDRTTETKNDKKKTTTTTEKTTTEQKGNSSSTGTSRQTRRTAATTEATTQAEISTIYGPETNQDGNSVDWISQQKDVIELEKDSYELREKGKSGIQYIDANGDVAKVLYQPEDSVDGKSYEEYYYQGNELIYASIWNIDGDGMGEQYYYNNGTLIQWVDSNGLIYNRETRGSGFEESSNWKQYLSAGIKAMRKSRSSGETSSEENSATTVKSSNSSNSLSTSVSTTATSSTAASTSLSTTAQ